MYDLLRLLGLGFGASETEFNVQFWSMSIIYHPEQHKTKKSGMIEEYATTLFHILDNAHSYLGEFLWNESVLGCFCMWKLLYQYKSFNGSNDHSYSYTVTIIVNQNRKLKSYFKNMC